VKDGAGVVIVESYTGPVRGMQPMHEVPIWACDADGIQPTSINIKHE
jgi:hypothetical protein